MRTFILAASVSLVAFFLALQPCDAQDAKKQIKPAQKWAGRIGDKDLANAAPKIGYLTNQKSLDELWTAWKLKDKAPTIDFAKQIVFVQLSLGGPNVPSSTYTLDEKGDLSVRSLSTLIGGPGFGYSIEALDRDGIKSYKGKAIVDGPEKKKTSK